MRFAYVVRVNARRRFLRAAGALLALPLFDRAHAAETILVHKGPQCGCCGEWENHLRAAGFRVESRAASDMEQVKRRLGVPADLWSCHTALVAGYLVEGHVPAADIRRLLRELPNIAGLAVPGMPLGAPGMEQGPPSRYQRYETVAFAARSRWVFARH